MSSSLALLNAYGSDSDQSDDETPVAASSLLSNKGTIAPPPTLGKQAVGSQQDVDSTNVESDSASLRKLSNSPKYHGYGKSKQSMMMPPQLKRPNINTEDRSSMVSKSNATTPGPSSLSMIKSMAETGIPASDDRKSTLQQKKQRIS